MTDAEIAATDPEGFRDSISALATTNPVKSPNQLSVYEVHVRDFTSDSSWVSNKGNKNGTYLAFAESGTANNGVSSGLDSLVGLHPDAVQLLPVFDQDNDERTYDSTVNDVTTHHTPAYNWGYNPENYNVVEGSYSSDPYSATAKMKELKTPIKALADNGIRTIMDVVYNHVSSVSSNSFSKIMPKYYFRTTSTGAYSDATGCGNEFASERPMAGKFIEQFVSWWAEEYGMKGFRFDLMAAIDTTTMKTVRHNLYAYDPNIVVYGEGWLAAASTLASGSQSTSSNVYSQLNNCGGGVNDCVGTFNDGVRKGLTGDLNENAPYYGFMASGTSDITQNADERYWKAYCGYLGENKSVGTNPYQTVNYASCHDNYTLYDQFNYTIGTNGKTSTADSDDAKKAVVGAESYILMGNGLAFFQGGEEIFRQKIMSQDEVTELGAKVGDECVALGTSGSYLVRNSYRSSDSVNGFKWNRKAPNIAYFNKLKAAFEARRSLYGVTNGLTTSQISSKVTPWNGGDVAGVIRIANEFNGTYYVFLAGRDGGSVGIAKDALTLVYSSSTAHTSVNVSTGSLTMNPFELLVCKK